MCSRTTNLYVAVRELAERLAPVVDQIERDLRHYNPERQSAIPAVRRMLESRQDGLALALLNHLTEQLADNADERRKEAIKGNRPGLPSYVDLLWGCQLPEFPEDPEEFPHLPTEPLAVT